MPFFAEIMFIFVSLLLVTYYRLKANQDDFNRPSFFNSKLRKYFLLCFAIALFILGEYLILRNGYTDWSWFLPLLYLLGYFWAKSAWNDNVITSRIFHYYKVFSGPEANLKEEDRLIAPVNFMLSMSRLPKEFQDKANKYIENRIQEGKIKSVKDLPNEITSILGSYGKDEIVFIEENKVSENKINYYYNKVIKGKEYQNLKDYLSKSFWYLEAQFEKLFKNYAFIALDRPDFSEEEVALTEANLIEKGKKDKAKKQLVALFPNVHAEMARKFGWVSDLDEYAVIAALEFQRRFPDHKFSKKIKRQHKYTNEQIFDYAQNWVKIDTSKIKVF